MLVLGVEQPRQLAERHAVADRHREVGGEAERRLVQRRPLDGEAVDRVRPVEHDDAQVLRVAASSITYAIVVM